MLASVPPKVFSHMYLCLCSLKQHKVKHPLLLFEFRLSIYPLQKMTLWAFLRRTHLPACLQHIDPVMKLEGKLERTETGRVAQYTQPIEQSTCPCPHLRRNIIFVLSTLSLRVTWPWGWGQAANLDSSPASRLPRHINNRCNFGYFCRFVTAGSKYFPTQLCLLKWKIHYYRQSQVRDCDPNILKGCPQRRFGTKAG